MCRRLSDARRHAVEQALQILQRIGYSREVDAEDASAWHAEVVTARRADCMSQRPPSCHDENESPHRSRTGRKVYREAPGNAVTQRLPVIVPLWLLVAVSL